MKSTILIILIYIIAEYAGLNAQQRFTKECDQKESVRLSRGETFFNNCDEAYVLNAVAAREMLGTIKKFEALSDSLESQRVFLKKIINNQDEVSGSYEKIISIQNRSFDSLKTLQLKTSQLVQSSLENTNRALSYAQKIKAASYFTGAVIGGVAGGLIDNDNKFGWGGAAIGAAGGILINYLIQNLF